jgi:hypothetical protein
MFIGVFVILEFQSDPQKTVCTMAQNLVESSKFQPKLSAASELLLAQTFHCAATSQT